MKVRKRYLLFLLVGILFFSCEKETDKNASCRISVTTESISGSDRVTTIIYNNDGNISSSRTTFGNSISDKVFNYSGNTIIIHSSIDNGSNVVNFKDSVTIDDRDRPLNIRQYAADGISFNNTSFEYSGDLLTRMYQTSNNSATPAITTATMENGNLVRLESPAGIAILEYYAGEEMQQGDYLGFLTFTIYGVPLYPQRNLIKTYDSGNGNIVNFNYEKNADGLISKVNITNVNTTTSISYQYECD